MVNFYRNMGRNLWKRNRPIFGMFVYYTACGQMCPVENTENFHYFKFMRKNLAEFAKINCQKGPFPFLAGLSVDHEYRAGE